MENAAHHPRAAVLCVLLCAGLSTSLGLGATETHEPFLNLRSRELEYAGPEADCSDLPEVRLGWFGPSDETNSAAGDMWWAANLAVREANEQGGYNGKPFRLVPRWSENPWGSGVADLARMVYEQRPVAVLGGKDSASTHLAEQVVAKANLTLVSPVATDPTATLAGVPWMYSCAPSDSAIAGSIARDVEKAAKRSFTKLALISGTDHESRIIAREVSRHLSRAGRLPDFRFEVTPGSTALDHHVAALKAAKPEMVVLIAAPPDAARLVRVLREQLPDTIIYGSQQLSRFAFLELAGASAEGLRVPLLYAPAKENPQSEHFAKEFSLCHKRQPDYTAAFTYDAARLLLEAIRKAGPHRAEIRTALAKLSPWMGVSGQIAFDGTGQNTRSQVTLGIVRSGTVQLLEPERHGLKTASNLSEQ